HVVDVRLKVRDLDFDIEVLAAPIVREADGVAMSSRNAYLSDAERVAARCLVRAVRAGEEPIRGGAREAQVLRETAQAVIEQEPLARIDYVELVDPEHMTALETLDHS